MVFSNAIKFSFSLLPSMTFHTFFPPYGLLSMIPIGVGLCTKSMILFSTITLGPQSHNLLMLTLSLANGYSRHKLNLDSSLARYKARWVIRGYSQQPSINYGETFSLVIKPSTILLFLNLAVSSDWLIYQLDVKNTFLHGSLQETVYCQQPTGYVDFSRPNLVCWLNKSLYSQASTPCLVPPLCSLYHLCQIYQPCSAYSLFIFRHGSDNNYLLLYVDNIVLTASSTEFLHRVISSLRSKFAITDLGSLNHFLGIIVFRTLAGLFFLPTSCL